VTLADNLSPLCTEEAPFVFYPPSLSVAWVHSPNPEKNVFRRGNRNIRKNRCNAFPRLEFLLPLPVSPPATKIHVRSMFVSTSPWWLEWRYSRLLPAHPSRFSWWSSLSHRGPAMPNFRFLASPRFHAKRFVPTTPHCDSPFL